MDQVEDGGIEPAAVGRSVLLLGLSYAEAATRCSISSESICSVS